MKTSILPAHLSELERELDEALSRIEDIDIPTKTLWDPFACPIEVLPYLAWSMSVDQWRAAWSEKIKRQVVANSLAVHRAKGTRQAVEQALRSLGIDAELIEWFETSPKAKAGTFELIAWINENLTEGEEAFLNQALYNQVKTEIDNAKNARSHYNFKIGAKFGVNHIVAASAISGLGALARREPIAVQEPLVSAAAAGCVAVSSGASIARKLTQTMMDASTRTAAITAVTACSGLSLIYTKMEAIK